jgi:hypothetical protein
MASKGGGFKRRGLQKEGASKGGGFKRRGLQKEGASKGGARIQRKTDWTLCIHVEVHRDLPHDVYLEKTSKHRNMLSDSSQCLISVKGILLNAAGARF